MESSYRGKLNSVCDFFRGLEEFVNVVRSVAVERGYADCALKSKGFHDSLGAGIQPLEYRDAVFQIFLGEPGKFDAFDSHSDD